MNLETLYFLNQGFKPLLKPTVGRCSIWSQPKSLNKYYSSEIRYDIEISSYTNFDYWWFFYKRNNNE